MGKKSTQTTEFLDRREKSPKNSVKRSEKVYFTTQKGKDLGKKTLNLEMSMLLIDSIACVVMMFVYIATAL